MYIDNKTLAQLNTLEGVTHYCKEHNDDVEGTRLCIIDAEFKRGFKLMKEHPRSVTFFGSARLAPETDIYTKVKNLAQKVAGMDYSIVTGGGHGLMKAANEGASLSEHGSSVGINIALPFEQTLNPFLDDSTEFHHFFSRKVLLAYAAEAYVYTPGGFGTLDELFELLTLKQTKKIPDTPIILYGKSFWEPLEAFIKQVLLQEGQETISEDDLQLYTITDNDDEVLEIIKNAKVRTDVSSTHHLGLKD